MSELLADLCHEYTQMMKSDFLIFEQDYNNQPEQAFTIRRTNIVTNQTIIGILVMSNTPYTLSYISMPWTKAYGFSAKRRIINM